MIVGELSCYYVTAINLHGVMRLLLGLGLGLGFRLGLTVSDALNVTLCTLLKGEQ